jgi:hypothetical protein
MNQAETRYAQHLELRRLAGEVYHWDFEGMKLRLGHDAWYKVDFLVQLQNGAIECHEFKGFWREAARVRIKVAASLYPCFRFIAIQERKQRDGGGYVFETIPASAGDSE